MPNKTTVRLGGVPLAGNSSVVWKFQTGTQPYVATFSVHNKQWATRLKNKILQPLDLVVVDSRGKTTKIKDLYILHEVASDSPHRTSFLVADRRWKWHYTLIARDYNTTKKSGDRTATNRIPDKAAQVTVDKYDFKAYSLDSLKKWTPLAAVKDVLDLLEGGDGQARYVIESFPIEDGAADIQFTMQNVVLRDQGDVALSRLLAYIPGAEVWVDQDGTARVFDASDLGAAEAHFAKLPKPTWDGDAARLIDRKKIRPSKVAVHYMREVECLFEFEDDYSGSTSSNPARNSPFLENVIPTVDLETVIGQEYDPEEDALKDKTVAAGTWVNADVWLAAYDKVRPAGSAPWTFETPKQHWIDGKLAYHWTKEDIRGGDANEVGTATARINAFLTNFRQTFRISRRYMERIRKIEAVRAVLLDPVTGQRAPATWWGEACVIAASKGQRLWARNNPEQAGVYINIRQLPDGSENIITVPPGPARINIIDRDQGIFRIEWVQSPYGTDAAFIPCNLVGDAGGLIVPSCDMAQQDQKPMGPGLRRESISNGLFLKDSVELKVMMTITPGAPNNKGQFHVEEVEASDVAKLYRSEFRIQDGEGPTLEVFVPPGEATARFAWEDDSDARDTIGRLLGMNSDDPNQAGLSDDPKTKKIDESQMLGFRIANGQRELPAHAAAVAAEMLAPFADSLQGDVATIVPTSGVTLKGNMSGATLQVGAYPSGKTNVVHEFPGQQRPISRFAMMPEDVRRLVLRIVSWGDS